MANNKEIFRLIAKYKKILTEREKTEYFYCKRCGGQLFTGPVNEVKKWKKEQERLHKEHNKNLLARIIDKLRWWYNLNNFIEGIKELIRVAILSVIPVAYLSIEQGNIDLKAILIVAVLAVLRGVEKLLHENDSKFQLPI